MAGRYPGQFPQGFGVQAKDLGWCEILAAEGIPSQPLGAKMPKRGAGREGEGNGESHGWGSAVNA